MKRVLIVDDEPDHRLILRTLLECHHFNCEEAQDGVEALAVLDTTPCDLILTDLNMPRMNGLQLIETIVESPKYQSVPIILVSNQIPNIRPAFGGGYVVAILPKPYDQEKLIVAVLAATEKFECQTAVVTC